MTPKTLIPLISLFSLACALKIRLPGGSDHYPGTYPLNDPMPSMDHQYHLIKTCDSITPQLTGADLLAYYSQDFYHGLTSLHTQLNIVRHEIQKMALYSKHRIVYQMQGSSGNLMYVALKIKVTGGTQVNIISYVQSADYSEIMAMMGFNDNQMFSYPCGNLHNQCVKAFVKMASLINVCQSSVPVVQEPIFMNQGMHPRNNKRRRRRKLRRKKRKLRRKMKKMMNRMNNQLDDMELSELSETPFNDVDATVHVTNDSGDMVYVGSSGPN